MKVIFVSTFTEPMERWIQAFPQLTLVAAVEPCSSLSELEKAVCFLDVAGFGIEASISMIHSLAASGLPVVGMSGNPDDQEAFNLLTAGARGYCHVAASPDRLREIATVVAAGQLWLPAGMIQNFVSLIKKVASTSVSDERPDVFDRLTEREYQVALAVGRGANNKEIADQLSVSERTVKAHLTSCFEKLGLRDRVQLALAVNKLPHSG